MSYNVFKGGNTIDKRENFKNAEFRRNRRVKETVTK